MIRIFKSVAPFGQSFLIAMSVGLLTGIIAISFSETRDRYTFTFDAQSASQSQVDSFASQVSSQFEASGCINHEVVNNDGGAIVFSCLLESSNSLGRPVGLFDGVILERIEIDAGHEQLPLSNWWIFISSLIPLALAIWLLGSIDFRQDLENGILFLKQRLWFVLSIPVLTISAVSIFSFVFPGGAGFSDSLPKVLVQPSAIWYLVFVAPVFEETIFRQWVYRRTIDRLPVWLVCLASSWFFTLIHVFNPQASAAHAYLPTIFLLGVLLFWIRYSSKSIVVTIASHIWNNTFPLIGAILVSVVS